MPPSRGTTREPRTSRRGKSVEFVHRAFRFIIRRTAKYGSSAHSPTTAEPRWGQKDKIPPRLTKTLFFRIRLHTRLSNRFEATVDYAEAFLRDQIPLPLRSSIPATLKTAYEAAALLIRDEPILNVTSAQDNRGRIVQWAVDLGFERLCQSGQWPFDFRWRYFERPTGRYFEILPSHSVVTISQVSDPAKQPRDVAFRANKRVNSQAWLRDLPKPDDEEPAGGAPHVLLVHGYQGLNFAHLGLPK